MHKPSARLAIGKRERRLQQVMLIVGGVVMTVVLGTMIFNVVRGLAIGAP